MSFYMHYELEFWKNFLWSLLQNSFLVLYICSITTLTVYAVWYLSSFAAYLYHRFHHLVNTNSEPNSKCQEYHHRRPRIAIIIPVYNDYEVLASLQSLADVDYLDYVVVVDDSTDEELSKAIANATRGNPRFIHVKRRERKGLKAGALNTALEYLSKYSVDYVLILDADFELPKNMLSRYTCIALEEDADVVQGHQRHFKGSNTLFGLLYRASMAGATLFLAGRMYMDMFPIFTGSCGFIKYDLFKRVKFVDYSISEDWRWTIDLYKFIGKPKIVVYENLYANGSVPKSFKAFWRQQIRWSSGTLMEFARTFLDVVTASGISFWAKVGYILHGLFYTQGLWVYVAIASSSILYTVFHIDVGGLFPLGIYLWLIGIITIILIGGVIERYRYRELTLLSLLILPMIYITALAHAYGTIKTIITRKAQWIVTSKRGKYEKLYRE